MLWTSVIVKSILFSKIKVFLRDIYKKDWYPLSHKLMPNRAYASSVNVNLLIPNFLYNHTLNVKTSKRIIQEVSLCLVITHHVSREENKDMVSLRDNSLNAFVRVKLYSITLKIRQWNQVQYQGWKTHWLIVVSLQ